MKNRISNITKIIFGALIALKILFLFSFFALTSISLLPPQNALAAQEKCTGENLIEQFSLENPRGFEELKNQAQTDWQNGTTKLFKIEKSGLEPSWLYGTMHVADPRVLELSAPAKAAFDASASLLVEIVDIEKNARAAFQNPKLRNALFLTDGSTLEDKLTQPQITALKERLKSGSTPWFIAKRMRPWLVMGLVSVPACEVARKQNGSLVLDAQLQIMAKANGIDLVGLESVEEQFSAFGKLQGNIQLQALSELVETGSLIDDVHATMVELYLQGNIGLIWPMISEFSGDDDADGSARAQFEQVVVVDRNKRMAERSLKHLEKGAAFIAVGSLHLPGEEGLVELFRQGGFTVTPVEEAQ